MKVTVLIPTRNRAALLVKALQSVCAQSFQAREIIVIDDGSEDDTASAVDNYGAGVRLIRQSKSGKAKALNNGFAASTGDAMLVLDDDDLLPPRALEFHVRTLSQSPDTDFSYGRFIRFQGEPPSQSETSAADVNDVPVDDPRRTVIKLMEFCYLPHPVWMGRRSALEKVGPYDEGCHRSQDFDMILRLARESDGAFVNEPVLYQRQHDGARPGLVVNGHQSPISAWGYYDRRIFSKIARTWDLQDFRPFATSPYPAHAERTAWLQKAVILFRRECYDECFIAWENYRHLLGRGEPDDVEIGVVSRMLEWKLSAELLSDVSDALGVRKYFGTGYWSPSLRRTIIQTGRWQLRAAVKLGQFGRAALLTRFFIDTFGPVATGKNFVSGLSPLT